MSTHVFTRDLVEGSYDIDNKLRADPLFKDIIAEGSLPTQFTIEGTAGSCSIIFSEELSAPQIATLTTIVNNHKNNL